MRTTQNKGKRPTERQRGQPRPRGTGANTALRGNDPSVEEDAKAHELKAEEPTKKGSKDSSTSGPEGS